MPIDPNASTVDSPVVVFEVVSEDTARTDRIVKLREYQATPSIQRYVILEQKSVGVSVFTRRDSDWIATALTEGDTLQMPEIDVEISIEEFYAEPQLFVPCRDGTTPLTQSRLTRSRRRSPAPRSTPQPAGQVKPWLVSAPIRRVG